MSDLGRLSPDTDNQATGDFSKNPEDKNRAEKKFLQRFRIFNCAARARLQAIGSC